MSDHVASHGSETSIGFGIEERFVKEQTKELTIIDSDSYKILYETFCLAVICCCHKRIALQCFKNQI